MTEQLLQFIWQFQYFNNLDIFTTEGQKITINSPGQLNRNQGADFDQARITIGDTNWAGKVELHIYASDWLKHKHDTDPNFARIILHVVWKFDKPITDALGHAIPTLELCPLVSKIMLQQYNQWMTTDKQIPCGEGIASVSPLVWQNWLQRLLVERLTKKHDTILQQLAQTNNHWEEVCWRLICKYFGGNVNSTSFAQLAESLPMSILAKHKNQIHQLEALLLGQAGLLHKNLVEQYPQMLYKEYQFLQKKYSLRVINLPPSFLRMRPVNFPTIRLAQLAMLIHQNTHLFAEIKNANQPKDFAEKFMVTANDYWHYHFSFDELTAHQPKQLGHQMFDTILINAIVPVLFSYGIHIGNDALKEKALAWLEQTKPEKNSKINPIIKLGVAPLNAFESQAMLQLKTNWCDAKACLQCAVGNAILKKAKALNNFD